MSAAAPQLPPASSSLAPFRVRSYRFQWVADLSTSWAFEMETIILAWYILVETQSVMMLTIFGSLQYLGTLLAPVFGVAGHRVGNKKTYCAMRMAYSSLAAIMMTLALSGLLMPVHVFVIAAMMGMVRPSDLVLRYALVGETMPSTLLMGATSISRTTQDSARIMGSLAGAGLVAWLGMGLTYVVITCLYCTSLMLSLRVSSKPAVTRTEGAHVAPVSAWGDLRNGIVYVWQTPQLLAAMAVAFLVNLTAFPLTNGLLPHVAKDIYQIGQTGLGYLVASFAFGALMGSITLTRVGYRLPPARMMIAFCGVWYVMILLFAQMPGVAGGIPMLMLTGFAQSLSMVPLSAMLLRNSKEMYRGHVMGMRMLMIYGVPLGLLAAAPLINAFGFRMTVTLYCAVGLACTAVIFWCWHAHIWRADAPANRR